MNRKAIISGLVSVALLWLGLAIFVPVSATILKNGDHYPVPPSESIQSRSYSDNDPARKTVCRQGCDYISLSAAISATNPLTPALFSILDGELNDRLIRIDQGKVIKIKGLGAHRTRIGENSPQLSPSTNAPIFIIEDGADVTLEHLTIWGGRADGSNGGGIQLSGSGTSLRLSFVTLLNNEASSGGGIAVTNGANLQVEDSIIEGNAAINEGGGIYVNGGSLTVQRVLLNQNSATAGGGIFYGSDLGKSLIENTTFASNEAVANLSTSTARRGGGGLYVADQVGGSQSSELDLYFSTLSGNQTADGGGGALKVAEGVVNTFASIYLANLAGGGDENCELNLVNLNSSGYNLASDTTCRLDSVTDLVSAVLMLEPLADNGGASQTFEVTTNTQAVGIVPITHCPNVDQRNLSRQGDSMCDAGAYEAEKYITLCRTVAQGIPDNTPAGLTDVLNASHSQTIYDLSVFLNLSNQSDYIGDFEATLTLVDSSPISVDLISKPAPLSNGACNPFGPTQLHARFNDSATNQLTGSVCFPSSKITASYQPLPSGSPLAALSGKPLNVAPWQLNLVDDSPGATGTLESWCVQAQVKPDQLVVTRADDPIPDGCQANDCSLREAIIDAGELPGRDTVTFEVPGPILLTQVGNGGNTTGDSSQVGDLDVTDDLILIGNITDVITIDASSLNDRIFDIFEGIDVQMSGLELTGGQVSSGVRGGAAILNRATFLGEHLLIRNNSTLNMFGYGAAIQSTSGGDFTLRNSEIISNSILINPDPNKGKSAFPGVYNWNSTMELTGVTIAGNNGPGSAVYNYGFKGDAVMWMNSVTLAANTASVNSGLGNQYNFDTLADPETVLVYLHNSVLGSHTSIVCDSATASGNNNTMILSLGYNLAADSSCNLNADTDNPAVDPLLNTLSVGTGGRYNGRLILKPDPLSLLHDNGDPQVCPEMDGRGAHRPQHARCDIGAVELTTAEVPARIYLSIVVR